MSHEALNTPTVDMSPEAIDRRFRMVESLRKLCLSLKAAGDQYRSRHQPNSSIAQPDRVNRGDSQPPGPL